MRPTKRQIVNYGGALVLPHLLLSISIWLTRTMFQVPDHIRGLSDIWVMRAAGIAVGTLFVIREFKWKGLAICFGYVPFLNLTLFYFGLWFVGVFYGLYL